MRLIGIALVVIVAYFAGGYFLEQGDTEDLLDNFGRLFEQIGDLIDQ